MPFVAVSCSNIPVGTARIGTFRTRAARLPRSPPKKGLFLKSPTARFFFSTKSAICGTQVRLLRIIQNEFTPVETNPTQVDVRIIAATNVDLKEAVKMALSRRFVLPPVGRFPYQASPPCAAPRRRSAACAASANTTPKRTRYFENLASPEVLSLLEVYYPETSELENIIERAVVIRRPGEITNRMSALEVIAAEDSESEGASNEICRAASISTTSPPL